MSAPAKRGARAPKKPYYVYLLECRGTRLYAGITTDIERRFGEHREGKRGAKFTRANPPVKLLAVEQVAGRSAALKLEARVKRLPRVEKLNWAAQHPFRPARALAP